MSCAQCIGIEEMFDAKRAASELRRYRRRGPAKTSRILIGSIAAEGLAGRTVLDVGAGIGAVHLGLLSAGAVEAVDVDASAGYLRAAREEAQRRGLAGRIRHWHGNFVELAGQLEPADIVTLDRVLCCYDDAQGLLTASAAKASHLLGLVYPVDSRWLKAALALLNLLMRALGRRFRGFAHPSAQVEAIAQAHGFHRKAYHRRGIWQVVVYRRLRPAA
jgi:magnesium-protoporphyrin O-methyltransferase